MSEQRNFWMRWRVRAGYPVAVIYWLLARPTPRSILLGGIVVAPGLLIRLAASGHLRKYEELATTGPYAATRNPLYLGSALLAGGFVIAGHSWWAGVLVAAYFAIFYYAVMRNEESDLNQRFGQAFKTYAARVPLFFPLLGSRAGGSPVDGKPDWAFSWEQYRRNREYRALVGTVAGFGILWLRMWVRIRLGY
ncbi:MAG TPA: isoprenylcysteine carboxylmethyltransferase family protein [Verrucomicrobiae bacterium]|nr:isoprenylcysteine carboxylmethyltransferase family protein [Verrucomicrobiae bacterium]